MVRNYFDCLFVTCLTLGNEFMTSYLQWFFEDNASSLWKCYSFKNRLLRKVPIKIRGSREKKSIFRVNFTLTSIICSVGPMNFIENDPDHIEVLESKLTEGTRRGNDTSLLIILFTSP